MKKTLKVLALILLIAPALLISSCKKEEAPKKTLADYKKEWTTGTWKQKDITLAVSTSVKVGGDKIPLDAGMSMLDDPTINMLLGALGGNPFLYTRDNKYTFDGDGSYVVEGLNDFPGGISPIFAGKTGKWESEIFGTVLALFPNPDERDPHWINDITSSRLNLSIMITLPGLGDVPMNLILEK